jgi:class 3 adenylate cyclase
MMRAPDYPCGYAPEEMEKLKGYIRGAWGKGASLRAIAPSELSDPEFVDWVAFAEQEGTSPGSALDLLEMNLRIDLRALLPTIHVPTVVLQAADDKMIHPGTGAYLAEHIANAKYVETPGDDHVFFFRNQLQIVDAVRWTVAQESQSRDADRFLSTVLVGHPHREGDDDAWLELVQRFRGQAVPGKRQACFDGPIRALRCGAALAKRASMACGVHAGEVLRKGGSVGGAAFGVAESIAETAPPGEVWVSRVVVDLIPGSDLRLDETGRTITVQGRAIALLSAQVQS